MTELEEGAGTSCPLAFLYHVTPYYSCLGFGRLHRAPNHISKMVLFTVKIGPPNWTRTVHLGPTKHTGTFIL